MEPLFLLVCDKELVAKFLSFSIKSTDHDSHEEVSDEEGAHYDKEDEEHADIRVRILQRNLVNPSASHSFVHRV